MFLLADGDDTKVEDLESWRYQEVIKKNLYFRKDLHAYLLKQLFWYDGWRPISV